MKRISVHLSKREKSLLKEYQDELRQKAGIKGRWKPTVADLIRFAIWKVYGGEFQEIHIQKEVLWEYIEKIRERREEYLKETRIKGGDIL